MQVRLLMLFVFFGIIGEAHEGHGIPGALPPAPHGGVVQEAMHAGADAHHGKEEKELFFEVVQTGTMLKIYPLILPEGAKVFKSLSVKNELSDVKVKIEMPRSKKTESIMSSVADDHIAGNFDPKGANRFIVHIAANFEKEAKTAKVQVEVQ